MSTDHPTQPDASRQPDDASAQREVYTIGYSEQRTRNFARRRAAGNEEGDAGFFSAHLNAGMSVVDCGCGPGSVTVGFAEIVAPGQVLGLDLGESQVETARTIAAEQDVQNVRFDVGSIYQVPAPDRSFDAAYTQFVLEFLRDPLDGLKEIHRVMKTGGVVGVKTQDWDSLVMWPRDPTVEEAWELGMRLWRHNGGDPHVGRRLLQLLRMAGFSQIEVVAQAFTGQKSGDTGRVGAGMCNTLLEPNSADQMIDLGWVDQGRVEEMRAAVNRWEQHPDAFRAYLWCQALAWKD